jgi:tetratricopeptide (TPR) repeat protein
LPAVLLALLVGAVFAPALRNGFVDYDDNGYVFSNDWVRHGLTWANVRHAFRTTEIAYWHPLTWISHLADAQLFGLDPRGHHATSVLLHSVNALLLFLVLRALTGAPARSWIVAAVFGLHPLHVESVAWVAERKDVLSTFWILVALGCHVQWVRSRTVTRRGAWAWYGGTLVAFAAGLMSKPMVVTLPCLLLVLDVWPLQRVARGDARRAAADWGGLFLEKAPLFVLAAAVSAVTVHAQAALGTVQSVSQYPLGMRLANAAVAGVTYLAKCLWPAHLAVFYPYPDRVPVGLWVLAVAVLLSLTGIALATRHTRPYLLVGWLWFLGTLVPVIGLVQVGGQSMADRYTYVPLIGVFVALVWGGADLLARAAAPRLAVGVAAAGLAVCSVLTVRQLTFWRTTETLFRHALAVTPDNATAHVALGYFYSTSPARLDEAVAEYRAAVRHSPRAADLRFSLGTVLARREATLPEAVAEFRAALRLDPRHAPAAAALARALEQWPGHELEAVAACRVALQLRPEDADLHNRLGNLLAARPEQRDEAIAAYRMALTLRPDWVEVHLNIGAVLAEVPGRLDDAAAEYRTVLAVRPDMPEAHNNLANALAAQPGRGAEAEQEYVAALRLRPDYFEAHAGFGQFLAAQPGRQAEALAHLDTALRLSPDSAPLHALIAQVRQGRAPAPP